MRLRAHDQYTSSTHWWKRWSPSKFTLHYAWGTNKACECKMALNGPCFMVTWNIFKTTSWGRPDTKPWDHGTPNVHNCWLILFIKREDRMNRISFKYHLVESPVKYDFILHSRIGNHPTGLWSCVGTAFGHFLLGFTIIWSRLLASVWRGPK